MEAVAAGDDVAAQLVVGALVAEADAGPLALEVVQRHVLDLEAQLAAVAQPRGDEVLDHLLLAVDRDRPPAGELGEVDAVPAPVEAQLEAVVDEALAVQALAHAGLVEQVDRALLEHAGAHARLDVRRGSAPRGRPTRCPRRCEQVGQQQPGRAGADDPDLGVHHPPASPSASTRWATANAVLAAGTPA